MSTIDLWARFLAHEKLTPQRVDDPMMLVELCKLLAQIEGPKYRPYAMRLLSRRLICITAMDHHIDLTRYRHRGKMSMGRGLLDAWNKCYAERYGSTFGTISERESIRRDVKTRLSKNQTTVNQ